MQFLTTDANVYFSRYLAKPWLTGSGRRPQMEHLRADVQSRRILDAFSQLEGLTHDPAYKVLDDWMSNIYSAAVSDKNAVQAKINECATFGEYLSRLDLV